MNTKKNDFKDVSSGEDKYFHMLDSWEVGDFIITLERRNDGATLAGMKEFYTFYHPTFYSVYTRSSQVYDSIDKAVLGALAMKYGGINSLFNYYAEKMLDIDNQNSDDFWE